MKSRTKLQKKCPKSKFKKIHFVAPGWFPYVHRIPSGLFSCSYLGSVRGCSLFAFLSFPFSFSLFFVSPVFPLRLVTSVAVSDAPFFSYFIVYFVRLLCALYLLLLPRILV